MRALTLGAEDEWRVHDCGTTTCRRGIVIGTSLTGPNFASCGILRQVAGHVIETVIGLLSVGLPMGQKAPPPFAQWSQLKWPPER